MSKYASKTEVPIDRSRMQIEKLLERYGASSFIYVSDPPKVMVGFKFALWTVRFNLLMPNRDEFIETPTGRDRSESAIEVEYLRAQRQRWRALHLVIQAKLEAVECGITTFEEEFLAHIITPDGKTVGEHALPQLFTALETGQLPKMLIPGIG